MQLKLGSPAQPRRFRGAEGGLQASTGQPSLLLGLHQPLLHEATVQLLDVGVDALGVGHRQPHHVVHLQQLGAVGQFPEGQTGRGERWGSESRQGKRWGSKGGVGQAPKDEARRTVCRSAGTVAHLSHCTDETAEAQQSQDSDSAWLDSKARVSTAPRVVTWEWGPQVWGSAVTHPSVCTCVCPLEGQGPQEE